MNRISGLDEPADLHAEHGSKTWARGVARKLRLEGKKLDSDVTNVQGWIGIAAEHEVWRILGYMSLDSFLVAEANICQSSIDSMAGYRTLSEAEICVKAFSKAENQAQLLEQLTSIFAAREVKSVDPVVANTPCTLFLPTLDLGVKSTHLRRAEIKVDSYAQHERAIHIKQTLPKKRKHEYFVETGGGGTHFVMLVKGWTDLEFANSGYMLRGLSERPSEVSKVAEYYDRVSSEIASRCGVLFDWRDWFGREASE